MAIFKWQCTPCAFQTSSKIIYIVFLFGSFFFIWKLISIKTAILCILSLMLWNIYLHISCKLALRLYISALSVGILKNFKVLGTSLVWSSLYCKTCLVENDTVYQRVEKSSEFLCRAYVNKSNIKI